MKILVAGGMGFIGSGVVKELRKRGIEVLILGRSEIGDRKLENGVEYLAWDLMKDKLEKK